MIRGTTPTHTWEIPFDTGMVKRLRVIYGQNKKPLFIKEKEECVIKDGILSVTLSQEESLMFDSQYYAQVQVKVLFENGTTMETPITEFVVHDTLDEEVLV